MKQNANFIGGLLATAFLLPNISMAEVGPGEFANTPEYKKCILQKEIEENKAAVGAVTGMLQNNKEEAKVVGYTTLGNQANMNQNQMFIHEANKKRAAMRKELQKFSKVKVNCKELEAEVRGGAMEQCKGGMLKLTEQDCKPIIERNPELTLWKR